MSPAPTTGSQSEQRGHGHQPTAQVLHVQRHNLRKRLLHQERHQDTTQDKENQCSQAQVQDLRTLCSTQERQDHQTTKLRNHKQKQKPSRTTNQQHQIHLCLPKRQRRTLHHKGNITKKRSNIPRASLVPFVSSPTRTIFRQRNEIRLPPLINIHPNAQIQARAKGPNLRNTRKTSHTALQQKVLRNTKDHQKACRAAVSYM